MTRSTVKQRASRRSDRVGHILGRTASRCRATSAVSLYILLHVGTVGDSFCVSRLSTVDDFVAAACLIIPTDSTRIHNPSIWRKFGIPQKPANRHIAEICLLSRGSQVRVLPGALARCASWPRPPVFGKRRDSLRSSRAVPSPAGRRPAVIGKRSHSLDARG